jgi:hypothetical protein
VSVAAAPPQTATPAARPPIPTFPPLPVPSPVQAAVELLFKSPPVFNAAVKAARAKIEARARALGYSLPDAVAQLRAAVPDWDAELAAVVDEGVVYPECVPWLLFFFFVVARPSTPLF